MEDDPPYEIIIVRVPSSSRPGAGELDRDPAAWETGLQSAVGAALRRHGAVSARINVALVDDARIAELNESHLNHSGPTDVLAFDLRDGTGGPTSADVEGDVVISVDTAAREAHSRGHPIEAELALYALHGTLHLLGYTDSGEEDAARMHELEDEILSAVGLGRVYRGGAP